MILMLSVCITVGAAGSSTIVGNSSATVGSNIEFTVNVSGCSDATSIAVAVSYSDDFELVSGTWIKSGSITKFDTATNKGALGGLSSPDVNGNLFKLVLKAKTASANAQSVSVNVIAKNGSTEIMNVTPSKSVKIDCATHTYGAYKLQITLGTVERLQNRQPARKQVLKPILVPLATQQKPKP